MPLCTESLAFHRRGSTRRNLPDDIQDVASAFLVLELFEFLCLDRVARSGSRISITFVPYLSLFRMVVLLVHIYLVRPYSLRCTPSFWRYGCFRVWRGETVLQISRHRVHLFSRFLLLPTPQVHPYHLPEFRRTPPSSSPPTQCRPPSPQSVWAVTQAIPRRIVRFFQT
ncbi:hypothetical protein BKA83DRAFT_1834804 [Pisolithus microcarpus]|nr:hypothetical protein BKA83DRAFT_1834804 [Pisolithus microcarpus]